MADESDFDYLYILAMVLPVGRETKGGYIIYNRQIKRILSNLAVST